MNDCNGRTHSLNCLQCSTIRENAIAKVNGTKTHNMSRNKKSKLPDSSSGD